MSLPISFALCLLPSSVMTSISVARSTTWKLVSAMPEASMITPEPRLRWGIRSGASPKKRRKNSSPKNSSNGVRPLGPPGPPRDMVLMLTTAGLIASATLAKVPVVSGICTGRMGAWTAGRACASVSAARLPAARLVANAPSAAPTVSATITAATNVFRFSCMATPS